MWRALAALLAIAAGLIATGMAQSAMAQDAMPESDRQTLVVVPEDTPREVREAMRVELQLSGRRAVFVTVAAEDEEALRELAAHGGAEVIALERRGAGVDLVRIGPGIRVQDHSGSATPRAIALLAMQLLEEPVPMPQPAIAPPSLEAALEAERSPQPSFPAASASILTAPPHLPEPTRLAPVHERVLLEALGAVLLGGSLAFGGALIADLSATDGDPFPWWSVGLAIGGTVGTTIGALVAGRLTGAEGDPFWTLLAGIAGGVVGALFLFAGYATDVDPDDGVSSGWTYLGTALAALLPPVLSIVAFELTVPASQTPRLTLELVPNGLRGTF
jgi:hypothetical protein